MIFTAVAVAALLLAAGIGLGRPREATSPLLAAGIAGGVVLAQFALLLTR